MIKIITTMIDHKRGSIQLKFDPPPNNDQLEYLRDKYNGWRYQPTGKYWYAYQTKRILEYAEQLTGEKLLSQIDPSDCSHKEAYVGISSGLTVCPTCNSLKHITQGWKKLRDHIVSPLTS